MILWDVVDTVLFFAVILTIGQLAAAFMVSEEFRNDIMNLLFKTFIIGLLGIPLLLFGYHNVNYMTQCMLETTIDGVVSVQDLHFIRLDLLLYSGIGVVVALVVEWMNRKFTVEKQVAYEGVD